MQILAHRLRKPDESGVSLIEVMVAFILFAIITAALVPALITSIKHTARNATIGTASQLANSRVEEIRAAGQHMNCAELFAEVVNRVDYFEDDRNVRLETSSWMHDVSDAGATALDDTCGADFIRVIVNVRAVDSTNTPVDTSILPNPVANAVTEVYLPNQVVTP